MLRAEQNTRSIAPSWQEEQKTWPEAPLQRMLSGQTDQTDQTDTSQSVENHDNPVHDVPELNGARMPTDQESRWSPDNLRLLWEPTSVRVDSESNRDQQVKVFVNQEELISDNSPASPKITSPFFTSRALFIVARLLSMLMITGLNFWIEMQRNKAEAASGMAVLNLLYTLVFNTIQISLIRVTNETAEVFKPEAPGSRPVSPSLNQSTESPKTSREHHQAVILSAALAYAALTGGIGITFFAMSRVIVGNIFDYDEQVSNFVSDYSVPFLLGIWPAQFLYVTQRFFFGQQKNLLFFGSTAFQIAVTLACVAILQAVSSFSRQKIVGISLTAGNGVGFVGLAIYAHAQFSLNWRSLASEPCRHLWTTCERWIRHLRSMSEGDAFASLLSPVVQSDEDKRRADFIKHFISLFRHGTNQAIQSATEFLSLFLLSVMCRYLPQESSIVNGFSLGLLVYAFMSVLQFAVGQIYGVQISPLYKQLHSRKKFDERGAEVDLTTQEKKERLAKIKTLQENMVWRGGIVAFGLAVILDLVAGVAIDCFPIGAENRRNTQIAIYFLTSLQVFDAVRTQYNAGLSAQQDTHTPMRCAMLFALVAPVLVDAVLLWLARALQYSHMAEVMFTQHVVWMAVACYYLHKASEMAHARIESHTMANVAPQILVVA